MKNSILRGLSDILTYSVFSFFNQYFYNTALFASGPWSLIPVILITAVVIIALTNLFYFLISKKKAKAIHDRFGDIIIQTADSVLDGTKTDDTRPLIIRIVISLLTVLLIGAFLVGLFLIFWHGFFSMLGSIIVIFRIAGRYGYFED